MTKNPFGRLCGRGLLVALVTIAAAGCESGGSQPDLFKPLADLMGMKKPVRIGVTRLHLNPLVPAPWQPLADSLGRRLGRPVQVIGGYTPFQIGALLRTGYLDLAFLSATDYVQVSGEDLCIPLACPIPLGGEKTRRGLIITPKGSSITSLADLKGQRFAFGPQNDAVLHLAAADALLKAGLRPGDLALELAPLPLSRLHRLDSREVAKAVAYDDLLLAGVVDEQEYSSWPEGGGSLLLGSVSKNQFRVIGRTTPVPEGPIVASKKADPALVKSVKEFLLSGKIPAEALRKMGWLRFEPVDLAVYEQAAEMLERLREAGWIAKDKP